MTLKIGTVTSSISRNAGGLFFSVRSLSGGLMKLQGVDVVIHGIEDGHSGEDAGAWSPLTLMLHRRDGPLRGPLAQAPGMNAALIAGNYDLLHTHGIWQWPSVAVSRWNRKTERPYLVSPRGMLDPWATAQSAWKKRLAAGFFENRHLEQAACLHALCASEADSMRAYGLRNPICIIPNGIDLPEDRDQGTGCRVLESGIKTLLFLGRLHPKKGLPNALRAWKKARDQKSQNRIQEEWQFAIAGWDQNGHEAELKRLCEELGLAYAEVPAAEFVGGSSSAHEQLAPLGKSATVIDAPLKSPNIRISEYPNVLFLGPSFGETKDALLRRASAFILPSFSEGLPMSVLEAWSYRLPVLMTDECNLPEGFAANAAIRIGTGIRGQESGVRGQRAGDRDQPMGIDEGIRALFEMTDAERVVMGQRGRALVEQRFTWPQVAAQMKEVYEWVLGGGARPDCVRDQGTGVR